MNHFKSIVKKELCFALCIICVLMLGACQKTAPGSDAAPESQFAGQEESGSGMERATGSSTGDEPQPSEPVTVRVGSLKGPTTMGIVNLMKKAETGETADNYEFTMATAADEISAKLVEGDLDIALIPANLAGVLYSKTSGGVRVIDINTLGVLYCVTTDDTVKSVADLTGKTVVTTGQGTTPEYALRTLLAWNGVEDCTLTFKSEASEVAALLAQDTAQIAVLPQPFATVAMQQNEKLQMAFSLSDAWDQAGKDSKLVTGVTVVRTAFLEEYPDAVKRFVEEHAESADKANADVDGTAELVAEYGILEKAPIAKKALPYCNIVCVTGEEMEKALSGYLKTLEEQNPKAIGGALPGDDFYEILGE